MRKCKHPYDRGVAPRLGVELVGGETRSAVGEKTARASWRTKLDRLFENCGIGKTNFV